MVEPRDRLEEDERDEEAWPPFCAPTVKGNTKATAINAIPIRVNIIKLPARNSVRRHYGLFKRATQGKGGDWVALPRHLGSASVFSGNWCLHLGHRAGSVRMNFRTVPLTILG